MSFGGDTDTMVDNALYSGHGAAYSVSHLMELV